jgi:CBS-domain-containing membrane protein
VASKSSGGAYLLQSLWALLFTVVMMAALKLGVAMTVIVALATSVFIVFAMPSHESAEPKNIILGLVIGTACGLAGHFAFLEGPVANFMGAWDVALWLACGLAVGLAVLLLGLFKVNHAPGAALALVVGSMGFDRLNLLFIGGFAIILSLTTLWLRPKMANLF